MWGRSCRQGFSVMVAWQCGPEGTHSPSGCLLGCSKTLALFRDEPPKPLPPARHPPWPVDGTFWLADHLPAGLDRNRAFRKDISHPGGGSGGFGARGSALGAGRNCRLRRNTRRQDLRNVYLRRQGKPHSGSASPGIGAVPPTAPPRSRLAISRSQDEPVHVGIESVMTRIGYGPIVQGEVGQDRVLRLQ